VKRLLVVLILCAGMVPIGARASTPCEVFVDPAGDASPLTPETAVVLPSQDAIDITGLAMSSSASNLEVRIRLGDLAGATKAFDAEYAVSWEIAGEYSRVVARRSGGGWAFSWDIGNGGFLTVLGLEAEAETAHPRRALVGAVNVAASEITVRVPLRLLGNPVAGTEIEGVGAVSFDRAVHQEGDTAVRASTVSDHAGYGTYELGGACRSD